MTRAELTNLIIEAKLNKRITWAALAKTVGRSEIWTTAALLGQMSMDKKANTGAIIVIFFSNNHIRATRMYMPPEIHSL